MFPSLKSKEYNHILHSHMLFDSFLKLFSAFYFIKFFCSEDHCIFLCFIILDEFLMNCKLCIQNFINK